MPRSPALSVNSRSAGLIVTVLLHVTGIIAWQFARTAPAPDSADTAQRIQWIDIVAPPKLLAVPPPVSVAEPPPKRTVPTRATEPARIVDAQPETPVARPAPAEASAPAPVVDARAMLEQAKRDVGKIDQALRKQFPTRGIVKPHVSAQMRLEAGMAEAADAVPNAWYEQPKVTEILDPGGYGRRRYKVVGAFATYCITVEGPNAPDGLDKFQSGPKQKITSCPKNESAATKQKW